MKKDKKQEQNPEVEQPQNAAPQTEENPTENIPTEETNAEENGNQWEDKYNELNNSHLRLMAEFDNYRKRTIKEKAEIIKNASERIIVDLLPIIDNFERALKSMETAENVEAVRTGVELIYNQIMNTLKNNGVTPIETEGLALDTEYHEAITTIPAPTPELKDKIIDCTTKGYVMNEKVIRHAKVVVGA